MRTRGFLTPTVATFLVLLFLSAPTHPPCPGVGGTHRSRSLPDRGADGGCRRVRSP